MQALHFGAGNIGRGFIGKALSKSGYNIIFSDINQDIIDSINYHKEYSIKIVGNNNEHNIFNVKKVCAVHVNNPKIIKIISNSDLITTAVGPNLLVNIASIIIDGIKLKIQKQSIRLLNIIACENKIRASSFLKKLVLKKLPKEYYSYVNEYINFIDCSIDTIIPSIENKNSLSLIAENFNEWIVDVTQFKRKIPKIVDMQFSNNLNAFIERKFFTLNTGHAIAAYLGLIKKYNTIQEAILDTKIHCIVKSAMEESGLVLIKRHNFNKDEHFAYIKKIFLRFQNTFLSDNLERIARNPLQKLNQKERLIKPFLRSMKYQLPCKNLAKGIAAVFYYYNPHDLESVKINSLIKNEGIERTLIKICNLSSNSKEIESIVLEYISIINTIQ